MRRMHFPGVAYVVREMREQNRSLTQTLLRVGVGVAYLLMITGLLAAQAFGGGATAPGQKLLTAFLVVNRGLLVLVGLVYFSTALGDEKDSQSRDLLLMSGLGPVAMLAGASAARQWVALQLLLVQGPLLTLCVALGGVSLAQVAQTVLELLVMLVVLGNLMLVASVLGGTNRACMLWALVLMVGWSTSGQSDWTMTRPRDLVVQAGWAALFFLLAASLLGWNLSRGMRSARVPAAAVVPKLGRRPPRVWPRFPIAWRDIHFQGGGVRWRNVRLVVCLLGAGGFLQDSSLVSGFASNRELLGVLLLSAGVFGLVLEITLGCSGFVRRERQEKTLETLFSLPLPTGVLLRDKVLAALHLAWPFGLLAVAGTAVNPGPVLAALSWVVSSGWNATLALLGLGLLLAFFVLTLVFSYTSRAPGWLGAGLVTSMTAIFFASAAGILHELTESRGGAVWPAVVLLWIGGIGLWVMREIFKDFARNLVYPED